MKIARKATREYITRKLASQQQTIVYLSGPRWKKMRWKQLERLYIDDMVRAFKAIKLEL